MTKRKKLVERRRHKRFRVQDDAFAVVTTLFAKRAEIIDISKGGLAFRYIAGKERANVSAELDAFLHIFLSDISFCLLMMPIRTISDFEIGNQSPLNSIRRRGVEFGELTQTQISELEYFIQNHTVGEV